MALGRNGPGEGQDGERFSPPPRPSGEDIAISVPAGVRPGHTKLAVEVGDGHELLITVPLQAEAGDRLVLRRGDKGAWACTLSRLLPRGGPPVDRPAATAPPRPPSPSCGKRITFLVPPDVRPNGMRLSVDADDEKVVLKVPVGAAPGDKVVLTKEPQPAGAGANGAGAQPAGAGAWRCTLVRERLAHNEVTSGRRDLQPVADLAPLRAPAPDPEAASRRLFDAMRAAGGTVNRKMVRGRAPPLNIPGVVAAEHIQAGEVLCIVPARFHLSPEMVERIAPRLWKAALDLQEVPAGRREELAHAAFVACLLHEAEDRALGGSSECKLAASAGVDPAVWAVWQGYADVLIGEDFAYHPYRRAAADPGGVCSEFDPSCEAHFFLDMAQDVCTIHAVVDEKAPLAECGFHGRRVDVGMFLRARLAILSRVFQTDTDSTLVPVGDSFNHAPDMRPGVAWCWDEERGAMVITAERDHQPGEELLCSYGPRSNLLLYRTYGFTISPVFEPSWSYVVRPHMVRSIYEVFLPEGEREPTLVFDSAHVEDSLCTVLNAVGRGPGFDPAEFLRLVAARCLWPYDKHAAMQPALVALRRARQLDPTSHAWWAQLGEADQGLVQQDVLRIQMCEYLCLTAHLEAVDVFEGRLDEARCLKGARVIRQLLAQALVMLREKRSFTIKQVPATEDMEGAAEGGA